MSEVILYAAIATVVCVMLYSVLGKSVGQGPESSFDPFDKKGKDAPELGLVPPVEVDPNNPGLSDIVAADPNFSPREFLDGAKQAYSIILEAFAEGDRETLQGLLTPDVYEVYNDAIEAREAQNLTQVTDLARLKDATIVDADKIGKKAVIGVIFESELSSALLDADGHAVEGDPDLLAQISEVWSFEREIKSKDAAWFLAGVSPSEGDALEADPTPDTKSE